MNHYIITVFRDVHTRDYYHKICIYDMALLYSRLKTGIKPVKPEHIDLAIVYAASILAEAGPTLRDVFLGMLGENRNLLAQVDDRETMTELVRITCEALAAHPQKKGRK